MKRWVTGHNLLKTIYDCNENRFFKDIEDGKRVPHRPDSITLDCGGLRIFPKECGELLSKISKMDTLREYLNKTDEEYLQQQLLFISGGDDEEFERLISEEWTEKLKMLAKIRPEKEQEFLKLLNEIKDPEEALSPSVVWRGITLTEEDQKRLLDACYLIDQEGTDRQENPEETYKELVKRLQQNGATDDEIIYELIEKRASPGMAGELVFPSVQHTTGPSRQKERDAFRKRAKRAYEKEKKKKGV